MVQNGRLINNKHFFLLLGLFFGLVACENDVKKTNAAVEPVKKYEEAPLFNSDSAYLFIEKQVKFGPRVPNTKEHQACALYLQNTLSRFVDTVIVQKADLEAYDGTILKSFNIIGSIKPELKQRILLCAHWDTRPYADNSPIEAEKMKPIDGANDGASGIGVLLELARQLDLKLPQIGVDIIFFDAEDYGQPEFAKMDYKEDTWCLGSQYWTKNLHVKGYSARYGILLDMVGAKNAQFAIEGGSMKHISVVQKVWGTAANLGHEAYFPTIQASAITDDHFYINKNTNIPCIDIIQYEPSTGNYFGSYWHTHNDNLSVIDKSTLKAVGETLLKVLYSEKL